MAKRYWWVLLAALLAAVALYGVAPDAAAQDDTLPQTYEDPGGVITLNYPDGWVADKYFGIIFLANSQAALEGELDAVEAGELQINVMAGAAYEVGLPESGTALDMAEAMLAEATAEPDVSNTVGPDALEGFQHDAARITVTQGTAEITAIIIVADAQHLAMLVAGAPQGELGQYEDTILAIAQSIQFVESGADDESPAGDEPAAKPENNAVEWQTDTVSLSADNFYITANGQTFTAAVDNVSVGGDPGDEAYTTLEVEWEEHGAPMRLYIYFEADGTNWQAFEIRIYDGSPEGEWIYFEDTTFTTPLGQPYGVMFFSRMSGEDELYFENLTVQAFTSGETEGSDVASGGHAIDTETTAAAPTPIEGPEDCHNVAVAIGDYSSEYSEAYAPGFLLDNDPTTGWSSGGVLETEYVVVLLDGSQTVYGLLFDSYSPSSGYETDSIKDFSLGTATSGGGQEIIFKGQAAFQQGYQIYTFDPVETDHLIVTFYSTHGGNYFEAADLMICAVKGEPPATGEEIRQWASEATATSQYTETDWSSAQATGEPDTFECGDYGTAWASQTADGIDELVLTFATPVVPTQINIYQTYNPGAIASVTLLLADGGDGPPVPNSADPGTSCPGVFTVNIPEGFTQGQPIDGIAILVDQSNHTGWNEIDAVELVGYAP